MIFQMSYQHNTNKRLLKVWITEKESELPKKKVNYRKRKWITERESTFNVTCSLICPPCLVPSSSLQLGTILANLWIQLLILSRRLLSTVMVGMWELNVRILIQNIFPCVLFVVCIGYQVPHYMHTMQCVYIMRHIITFPVIFDGWPST